MDAMQITMRVDYSDAIDRFWKLKAAAEQANEAVVLRLGQGVTTAELIEALEEVVGLFDVLVEAWQAATEQALTEMDYLPEPWLDCFVALCRERAAHREQIELTKIGQAVELEIAAGT